MIRAISWQSSVFWRWCPGPDSVTFDEMVRSLGGSVSAGAHVLRVRAAISGVFLTGTVTTGVLLTSCFGGQSGGETGELSPAAPDSPAACACVAEGTRPVRAQVTRLEAGGGMYLRRNLTARAVVQRNWRDGGRIRTRTFVAGQLAYSF